MFTSDCLQRCLSIYGLKAKIIDCSNLNEQQARELVCSIIIDNKTVILELKEYADILFVFGYADFGKVLSCCAFLDGVDERNCSYDFSKYRLLRNRMANLKRLIILEEGIK